ncbi:MAG: Gfo/Idh/MocA family oxidoreductase [Actinomycetota bacterium]
MSDDVRYGIVGTGMMGVEHLLNVDALDGARVTALCDTNEHSLARASALAPSAAVFRRIEDMLAADWCDAIVVATPNHTHVDVLRPVLATGLPVLIEKPLCTTVADCEVVLELANGHPGPIWMGLEYRYMAPVARLIDHVRAGNVGAVRMVAIREHRFPFLQKVDNWNRFNRNTGGTLVEKCCHFFDLMNLLTGDRAVRVFASGGQAVNHLDEWYGGERSDVLDHAVVVVEYDSGTVATLDLCMFAEGSENQEEVSVVGDRGKVEAFLPSGVFRIGHRDRHRAGEVDTTVVTPDVPYLGEHHGSSFVEHRRFLDAIRNRTSPEVTLVDGLRSVAIGVAAHRSIELGGPVELIDVLAPPPAIGVAGTSADRRAAL